MLLRDECMILPMVVSLMLRCLSILGNRMAAAKEGFSNGRLVNKCEFVAIIIKNTWLMFLMRE